MSPVEKTGAALLDAFGLTGQEPISAWPEFVSDDDDDDDADWIVGKAKHDWEGPYYAVTAEDIEAGITPGMYEEIATMGRAKALAFVAHLNALLAGGAA